MTRTWIWLDSDGDPYAVAVAAGFVGAKSGERHFHIRKEVLFSGSKIRFTVLVQSDLSRFDLEYEVLTVDLSVDSRPPVLVSIDSRSTYDPNGMKHLSALVAAGWFLDRLGVVVEGRNLTTSAGTLRQMVQARGGPPYVPVRGELGWTKEEAETYGLLGEELPVYWKADALISWGEEKALLLEEAV